MPASHIYDLDINANKVNLYLWEKTTEICSSLSIEEWLHNVKEQQNLPDDEFVVDFDNQLDLNDEVLIIFYSRKIRFVLRLRLLRNWGIILTFI